MTWKKFKYAWRYVAFSAAICLVCIGDAMQGPVWLWRLNPTGVAASSRFSFSAVARVTGPGLNEAASGCLAVSPARRNPFHSILGQALSHDVYRSVTLALNQVGTHLTEEVWERRKQVED